jgi:peroxiredoxin
MDLALLGTRLLLAVVFLVAGLTKLADLAGTRQAVTDFGVPVKLASAFSIALPIAELVVALTLVPRPTAWWGAIGALALLLLFNGAIGYHVARGRTPACHCFGQLHSEPVGWSTLARNGLLAVVAGFGVIGGYSAPGLSAVAWLAGLHPVAWVGIALALLLSAAVAMESWLLYQTLQQNGRLLLRLDALEARLAGGPAPAPALLPQAGRPVGSKAPDFSLPGLDGVMLTLEALCKAGKPVVLTFIDPDCGPCTALLPDLERWQHDHADQLTLVLISRGTVQSNRAKLAEHSSPHILLQQDLEVAHTYQVTGTPSAILVRPDGTIGSPLAQGPQQVTSLLATVVGRPTLVPLPLIAPAGRNGHTARPHPVSLEVGEPAPTLQLPDLTGALVDLADFHGNNTLVLFWNPTCGFCQRMLDDLKAWEAKPPKGAPQLVVVSTGAVEANQGQGFRAPLLLDPGFNAGQAFGVSGTPSAVLLDGEGKIAAAVAVGAPRVLALAGVTQDSASPQSIT